MMHHVPGLREKDLDKFLDYGLLKGGVVILSRGRNLKLIVNPNLALYLKKKGVGEVFILETDQAFKMYEQ
jgi:hypothetical protein